MEGEPQGAIPPQAAPLNAPVSRPQAREVTTSDVELLTRLEQLVTEGVTGAAEFAGVVQGVSAAPAWPC